MSGIDGPESRLKVSQRPPRARPRRAPQVRPEQILDAAVEVLLERGLPATTMDHIANTAGIAKGTMYLYFESKTQILSALRTRWVKSALVACNAAVTRARRVAMISRIQRFMEVLYDLTAADQRLLAILFHEAGMGEGNEILLVRDELLRLVQEGVKAGELEVRDPELTVSFLVHGVHGIYADALDSRRADRRRIIAVTRHLIRLLLEPRAGAG